MRSELTIGDADGDGIITLKDATAAMKQYNQTEILGEDGFMTAQQIENADLDGDGAVTAKDATYIQKIRQLQCRAGRAENMGANPRKCC